MLQKWRVEIKHAAFLSVTASNAVSFCDKIWRVGHYLDITTAIFFLNGNYGNGSILHIFF